MRMKSPDCPRERLRDCSRAAVCEGPWTARGRAGAWAARMRVARGRAGAAALRCADAVCDVSTVRVLAYTQGEGERDAAFPYDTHKIRSINMAILRHRSICALSALILAAVCALCIVAPGCALAAEVDAQADDANSWRFADGQLLTVPGLGNISLLSSKSYTEFDATLTSNGYATVNRQTGSQRLIPGAIFKGVDVSEHNRTIDWEAAKNDGVKFAIIRVGYGNDLTNQDDKYWLRNVSECERLGIPYGVYIYSYAKNADMARSEADHVLRLIAGHDLSYPVYFDMEDKSQFNATGGDPIELAKIASAFSERIEAAGYDVGIYANRNWFTYYLTDPVFDNWVRWVAEYGVSHCQYGGEYGMWQLSSGGRVKGIDYPADDEGGRVDVNLMYRAGYSSDVAAGDWFVESGAFEYVVIREIMGNYSGTNHFGPYDTITRAQVATILWRLAGSPASSVSQPFSDADPNEYYYNALCWAKGIGVSTGYSGTDSFGPNDPVTREQLATLFARYASVVDGRDTSSDCSAMNSKNGADEVSGYAREAMGWAVDAGLITGVNGTDLEPGGTAWRASMAEMVKRYSSF